MTRLATENLTVRRGGRDILREVTLALPAGALVAVIGANGAGKSTLLAALAGLTRSDAGTVSLDGMPLAQIGLRDLARQRAYLPQNPRCDWPIAVERVVALGLTPVSPLFGGLPAALAARVDKALIDFDLAALRDQAADTLSGGELARAMLARALVGDPELVIADEPLTGLDPRHALDSVARLRRLANAGKLVVASMHDLTLAARHATHIVALREGRLVAFGPTAATLTAELLKSVFEVEARVVGEGATAVVDFRPA
jgi:iron complex transport system ATP-binding protein